MATVYSDQRANDVAIPPLQNDPNNHGKLFRVWFSLNTTDTPVDDGDTIELCKIPAGVRLVGGYLSYGAMGALATLGIGVSGSTDKYLAAADVSAAGTTAFGHTPALSLGEVPTEELLIIGTAGGASFAAAKDLEGYIEYISAGQ